MTPPAQRALAPNALFCAQVRARRAFVARRRRVAYVTSRTVQASGKVLFELTLVALRERKGRCAPTTTSRGNLRMDAVPIEFAGNVASPRWSPDGASLAFIGTVDGQSRLYV
jgi:Tol biopolymer transport system component